LFVLLFVSYHPHLLFTNELCDNLTKLNNGESAYDPKTNELVYILNQKYVEGRPLYRQEKQLTHGNLLIKTNHFQLDLWKELSHS